MEKLHNVQPIIDLCATRLNTSNRLDDVVNLFELSSLIRKINDDEITRQFGFLIEELNRILDIKNQENFDEKKVEEISRNVDMYARYIYELSDHIKYEYKNEVPKPNLVKDKAPEFVKSVWIWFIWRSSTKLKQALSVMKYINERKKQKINKYIFTFLAGIATAYLLIFSFQQLYK